MPVATCHPSRGMGAPRDADLTPAVSCAFLTYLREKQRPAQRLAMRQVREVLRRQWACGLRDRKLAPSLRVSRPTVAEYGRRAQAAGVSWPLPDALEETALERRLFARAAPTPEAKRPLPAWGPVHRERKGQGGTLGLVWQEYKALTPAGLQYSQCCAA